MHLVAHCRSRSRRDGSRGMGLGFARYSNEAAYAAVVVEVEAGATIKVVRAVAAWTAAGRSTRMA